MWQFPNAELLPGEAAPDAARRAVAETVGLDAAPEGRATLVRHSVTRYRITLEAYHCPEASGEPSAQGCQTWNWVCPSQLGDYALPAAHRRIAQRALACPEGQMELQFP
jgi:A/G-specific adenine glycosylase